MSYITFQPSDHFNTKLYTGDGTTSNAQTGIGFQPDLVWTKGRSDAYDHTLTDAVRGATKYLISNSTNAEATGNIVTSFDSDGFTLGNRGEANNNNSTYVAWNWKANGAGSSNTDGSITSTVSASTTSGFSIVTYTGTGSAATVGHGLGSAPSVIIQKKRSASATWLVKHPAIGTDGYIRLDATNASATDSAIWNSTDPTSTVFSIGTDATINGGGATNVAYCFAEKKGFSKFGSYTGNGSTDGTFVFCGFKPAFILFKETTVARDWIMYDNKRIGYNPTQSQLQANGSGAETTDTTAPIDLCSNGFKLRGTKTWINESGQTYIFMAFAEHPLVSSNDIPATAR